MTAVLRAANIHNYIYLQALVLYGGISKNEQGQCYKNKTSQTQPNPIREDEIRYSEGMSNLKKQKLNIKNKTTMMPTERL